MCEFDWFAIIRSGVETTATLPLQRSTASSFSPGQQSSLGQTLSKPLVRCWATSLCSSVPPTSWLEKGKQLCCNQNYTYQQYYDLYQFNWLKSSLLAENMYQASPRRCTSNSKLLRASISCHQTNPGNGPRPFKSKTCWVQRYKVEDLTCQWTWHLVGFRIVICIQVWSLIHMCTFFELKTSNQHVCQRFSFVDVLDLIWFSKHSFLLSLPCPPFSTRIK